MATKLCQLCGKQITGHRHYYCSDKCASKKSQERKKLYDFINSEEEIISRLEELNKREREALAEQTILQEQARKLYADKLSFQYFTGEKEEVECLEELTTTNETI